MNQHCYRIVMSQARGQLMAVAETAKSDHSLGSNDSSASSSSRPFKNSISPVTLSVWLALGLLAFGSASAQIVADPRSPANQQPSIFKSGNGTTVVNIQAPSAAGVSRNTYTQFDVDKKGAILNNARTGQYTVLGGAVAKNPALGNRSARVILNEVNSSKASELRGYIEVSGDRAQVIIANPSGVTCDGCGFINANRATLTTGTPVMNGGSLESYRVERGTVKIGAGGMDASGTSYTDIISRAVVVNGKVYAKDIKVTAGANLVSADHRQATAIAGKGPTPEVAIDTALLGGMYAQKIMLISTEAGVGVRNAGQLGASAGDVVITADGKILNTGQINASGKALLNGQQIANSGTIYSAQTRLKAERIEHTKGLIASSGLTQLQAPQIQVSKEATLASGLQVDGSITGIEKLQLEGVDIESHGQHLAAGGMDVKGRRIDLSKSDVQTQGAVMVEASDEAVLDDARMFAGSYLMAAYVLSNRRGRLIQVGRGSSNFRVRELDNSEGTILVRGDTSLDLGKLNNHKGVLSLLEGALSIKATDVSNIDGEISTDKTIRIDASGVVDNSKGLITGEQVSIVDEQTQRTLQFINTGGVVAGVNAATVQARRTSGDGEILTQGELTFSMQSDVTHSGRIVAKVAHLDVGDFALKNAGEIAAQSFDIKAKVFNNADKGTLLGDSGKVAVAHLDNHGLINVGDILLDAESAINTGRLYGNQVSLGGGKIKNEKDGVIASRVATDVGAGEVENRGEMVSLGSIHLGGKLDKDGRATGTAQQVLNSSGLIEAVDTIDIDAAKTINKREKFKTVETVIDETSTQERIGRWDQENYRTTTTTTTKTEIVEDSGAGVIRATTVNLSGEVVNDKSKILSVAGTYDPTKTTQIGADAATKVTTSVASKGGFDAAPLILTTKIDAKPFELANTRPMITANEGLHGTNKIDIPTVNAQPGSTASTQPNTTPAATGEMLRANLAVSIPASKLFQTSLEGSTFIQSDARFVAYKQWLGSDTQLRALGIEPESLAKRLGDGYLEQRLVRDQINQLTGELFLEGFASAEEEYKALLDGGVAAAKELGLKAGQALTQDQIAKLKSNIVWLEKREVTLPSGEKVQALFPQLYAKVRSDAPTQIKLTHGAGVESGRYVDFDIKGEFVQKGTLKARELLQIKADNLRLQGDVLGQDVTLKAAQDITSEGATVRAQRHLMADAGQDIISKSVTGSDQSELKRVAQWSAGNGESGDLVLTAGRDAQLDASLIQNSSTPADGSSPVTLIKAGRDAKLGVVTVRTHEKLVAGKTTRETDIHQDIGTQIESRGDIHVEAGRDLAGIAAHITSEAGIVQGIAGRDISLDAGEKRSVIDETTVSSKRSFIRRKKSETHTHIEETENLGSSVGATSVSLQAGRDINARGAHIKSDDFTQVVGGRDVNLLAAQNTREVTATSKKTYANDLRKTTTTTFDLVKDKTSVASVVEGKNVLIKSGGDIRLQASNVAADQMLDIDAGRDLTIEIGQDSHSQFHLTHTERKPTPLAKAVGIASLGASLDVAMLLLLKKEGVQEADQTQSIATGSTLSAGSMHTHSGRDTTLQAATVVADDDVSMQAGGDLRLTAVGQDQKNRSKSSSYANGQIGKWWMLGVGVIKQGQEASGTSQTLASTQVASLNGNVNLQAGNAYQQTASQVIAPKGDIGIKAKQVQIESAQESGAQSQKTHYAKTALGGSIDIPLLTALKSMRDMKTAASETSNTRMKALAGVNAAMTAANAAGSAAALASGSMVGIKVSVSLSHKANKSAFDQSGSNAVGSVVSAGGNVNIEASGAGANSSLSIIGSEIDAGDRVRLKSDGSISLKASQNTATQRGSNSSNGGSIGIGFAMGSQNGFTIDFSASQSRGKADGSDTAWSNTHITAGNAVSIESGGDTTLQGAVVSAKQITGDIRGNLKVESLQDSSHYDSKQSSAGVGVSLCAVFCAGTSSVSVSASKSAINSDYLSVGEQSGFRAGDDGYQIKVGGDTTLIGGAVASSDKAIAEGKNSFVHGGSITQSDIHNSAAFTAKSSSASVGVGSMAGASFGSGKDSGSETSVTRSGIGVSTSADTAGVITPIFDAAKVQRDIDAQTRITQTFSQLAPKAVAEYAEKKLKSVRDANLYLGLKVAEQSGQTLSSAQQSAVAQFEAQGLSPLQAMAVLNDPQMQADYDLWKEGGAYRIALHTVVGAMGGGFDGALGAGAVAGAAPALNTLQAGVTKVLIESGMSEGAALAISQGVAQLTAAGIGATVGAEQGAGYGLVVDTNNRQLHPSETKRIKELAKGDIEAERRLLAAACAMVHCADGVPKDDPNYDALKKLQDAGSNYMTEQALLTKQVGATGRSVGTLFQYSWVDEYLLDPASQNKLGVRTAGAAQAGAGAGGLVASGAACVSVAGCGLGLVGGVVSLDYAQAGVKQSWTGESAIPEGEKVLQSLGMTPASAALTYSVLGIASVAAEAALLNKAANEVLQASNAARTSYAITSKPNGTIFSGHGGYEIGSGMTVVPENTSLTVYSKFGATITDRLGNVIETGGDLSNVYSRTYVAGERLPNYTLYAPDGLAIKGSPITVTTPTPLSDLLKPGMGECQWAACTYNFRTSNSNAVFDTVGIADKQTKQWITIYSKD